MKEIKLSRGKIALVSNEDFERLNKYIWYAVKHRNTFYAVRTGIGKHIYMHRDVLLLTDPKIKGDHIDHNGLNNQRNNLRITDNNGNNQNRKSAKNSSSQYLGVHLIVFKKGGKRQRDYQYWRAGIKKDGKQICTRCFQTEKEAAIFYNKVAIELHGEFANLNII